MKVLNIYGQPMEHMDAEIIGNSEALILLRDTIDRAIKQGEAETPNSSGEEPDEPLFTSDGEGYTVKVTRSDEDWLSDFCDFWKKHPPFYHRI